MRTPTVSPSSGRTASPGRDLLSFLRRWTVFAAGMAVLAAGLLLLVRSPWGAAPWDVFHLGLALQTGLSFGTILVLVSFATVLTTLALGGAWSVRPATLWNALLAGGFIDLYVYLDLIPEPSGWAWGAAYLVGGIVTAALGMVIYLRTGLGAGARDGLMLVVSQRTRFSPGQARLAIEVAVALLGWLLGGPLGPGTVIASLATGPVSDLFFRLLGPGALGDRVRIPGAGTPPSPDRQEVLLPDGKQ